jgi:flagellar basal body rod protein FlgB
MIHRLLGADTAAATLKDGLNATTARTRRIADTIANASTPGFADALNAAEAGSGAPTGADLESQMVSLADEQLRFEALTRLLQKTYAQVRASVRERS